ncbi:putative Peptidase C39, bacteriocin processing [Verrucomicrobia bacterium]|nr:putative Peptidase C39, bacteriocin processing [Verrucomicrobiota bacterium]
MKRNVETSHASRVCRGSGSRYQWAAFVLALALAVRGEAQAEPNRTLPKVEPPKAGLTFSTQPTSEEIFRAHIFAEPLVVVGAEPSAAENAALAAALLAYAKRSGPDDFSALTGFLKEHTESSWAAALLTDLGLEYYNTAHYSLAMGAWSNAWALARKATDAKSAALVSRAFGELIRMDSRLGRMDELERLLNSIGNHPLPGPAGQRVVDAREALWSMKNRPEISFRCGPLALRSIRLALGLPGSSDAEILKAASTQKGCSLPQVAELSRKIGLNYQMAFREPDAELVVPSVVHWKVGHYAALVCKVGNLYELLDPTFGNKTWATQAALEAETSGYFLVPSGSLPAGWRAVDQKEGAGVWGKGMTGANDPQHIAKNDLATGGTCSAQGMAVAKVHLMDVNLDLTDQPVGYMPSVGPSVPFTVRYNQRDVFQPANFSYGNLGPQWTSDWFTYITDNPTNLLADVNLYVGGGGQRTYTGFNTNTQSYAYQQYDQNLLTRTGLASYQLLGGDGSKMIFSQSDGSIGTSRNIFLTQKVDPQGNAVTLTYDDHLCLVAITDAIGQATTLTYGLDSTVVTNYAFTPPESVVPADPYKLAKVSDPFGRSATFDYSPVVVEVTTNVMVIGTNRIITLTPAYAWQLVKMTDVIGLTSQFGYYAVDTPISQFQTIVSGFVNSLTTPYGTTTFSNVDNGNTRSLDIAYPDGSRERVEYNQGNTNQPLADPAGSVPIGMLTYNAYLRFRDTYYWDRTACALGYGDYSQARLFHFLHTENMAATAGALESVKMPLEGRVWYDYAGQSISIVIGPNTLPAHVGRVLDDGTTQLFSYAYNPFGHVTNSIDPLGRTLSYLYDTNDIDLLEIRQTRASNNELLARFTHNSQHRPLTITDAAGQTTTFTYNAWGQVLTATDPKGEIITLTYNTNGYLVAIDGPLAGTNDVIAITHDPFGRPRTVTSARGYTLTLDYDNLDRLTRITHPDTTFSQYIYDRLDLAGFQDRAGRQTSLEHNNMRQLISGTDATGRVTHFQWCRCGELKSVTDAMGRTTSWLTDVQGRRSAKLYADGSQIHYSYENTTSRLLQVIDEKQQSTFITRNLDNSIKSISDGNTAVPTPNVSLTYDPNYQRVVSMTDGIGTTTYIYSPITVPPVLGAGRLASVDGPLANDTVTYIYDELGRAIQTSINGIAMLTAYDAAGRATTSMNALGSFNYGYDGNSYRLLSESFPSGQTMTRGLEDNLHDRALQQITYTVGATLVSQFRYGRDIPRMQITNWSQQAGGGSPLLFTFGYDAVNQLLSAAVTNSGALINSFAYSYDPAGNRVSEQAGPNNNSATFNALNQPSTTTAAGCARTNEWDGANRLIAVNCGPERTVFGYDGFSRLAYIQQLQDGSQVSFRRFVWCGGRICEERDATGTTVTKRFFPQGVELETGTNTGAYYYTRDHLGSIREMTDAAGNVRARYSYDPFGRQTRVSGDVGADFGFAGMFWSSEANLGLTRFRAYDPNLGRWLSRDPLGDAEAKQGPNLYTYVGNEPVGRRDPQGLAALGNGLTTVGVGLASACAANPGACQELEEEIGGLGETAPMWAPQIANTAQMAAQCAPEIPDIVSSPALQTFVQAVVPEIPDLLPRLQSLANGYQQVAPAFQNLTQTLSDNPDAVDVWARIGEGMGNIVPEIPELDSELQEMAWDLAEIARRLGATEDQLTLYNQALSELGRRIAAMTGGFNPSL